MTTVISVENLSKSYRLGQIGTGTFAHDLSVWWARLRGKPNPMLKIGESEFVGQETEDGRPGGGPSSPILWALRDVSFTVEQGEVLGIIGRNGAGKSTLLKILSRVTAPTSGRIRVKGRIASLLEVGTGFHPELTGRENIYLNGAILGMKRDEITRKFDEIVDFAGVEKFIDTPVKRYSSGMYVRLAFAVAAHLEPEILVVDEVLAVGDAEFQKKCLGKMGEVAKEGRTVLFVSHNMGAITSLCERVLVLQDGRIAFDGENVNAINRYLQLTQKIIVHKCVKDKIAKLPPDPIFQLTDFSVIQESEQDKVFFTNKPITVRITYQVLKPVSGLRVGFDLKMVDTGFTVFRSFHDDLISDRKNIAPGHYISEAKIPANLLSNLSYEIVLLAGIHNVRWIIRDQIELVLELTNTQGVNSQYSDARPGVLMPDINWVSKPIFETV